ncbi:MAG: TetR/AcrR family transcriptional regulator [Ilumatobacteraceae bacterium]
MPISSKSTVGGSRGRPRSFDVDAVTERALGVFWEHGYEATSLDALVVATGINVSSLYAAYGSKRGLFQAAMTCYEQHVGSALEALAAGSCGLDDVVRFVEWVRGGVSSDVQPPGCLIVNTMVEFATVDPEIGEVTQRYRERVRRSLRAAFTRAERSGEIELHTGYTRAVLVQAALFGALVTARSGAVLDADRMLRGLVVEIGRWRS